ncbi:MAG: SDR family oxidoreductase [Candidatus Tectomicrobia bacterium]|uniref:SDR family oxidoreductase n=1 Tax=Tectimicrobiota bacterium TaxID=2528274 RepID=A0A932CRC1_UNCTE|nr:SDR family oxidoreductase [Candidatus Tectomicrobia bacterium]
MFLEQFDLEDRIILVTGAGRGLGRAMSLALARAGAHIVAASRTAAQLEQVVEEVRGLGRRAVAIPTDITTKSQVEAMVSRAEAELGPVDVLINNAGDGSTSMGQSVLELTEEEWRRGIDVNLTGAFLCSQAAGRYMLPRKRGKIINISSGFGMRGSPAIIYSVAKAGLINLTQSLAFNWAPYNLQVNCIAPGWLPTTPPESEEVRKGREITASRIPMRRVGLPEEMGGLAVFLSSAASDYVTGQTILVDGGGLAGGYAPLLGAVSRSATGMSTKDVLKSMV